MHEIIEPTFWIALIIVIDNTKTVCISWHCWGSSL